MRNKDFWVAMFFSSSCLVACKPSTSSENLGAQNQFSQQAEQGVFPSPFDVQEFYQIAKDFYFNKLKTTQPEFFSQEEKRLMNKLGFKPEFPAQTQAFAETMFELLESGLYEQKLHGIPRATKLTRTAPKGLSNRDLQDFFQVVKMEYFKRITKNSGRDIDARESDFFERTKKRAQEAKSTADDALLIASDLFDKLEGIK